MTIDVQAFERMVADSTPGRFEGEGAATAYYWDACMNGDGEWLGDFSLFEVSDEEREAFEITADCVHYLILQTEQGFIYGYEATAEMVEGLREDVEAEDASDPCH